MRRMKKKFKIKTCIYIIFVIFTLFLITGCAPSQSDYSDMYTVIYEGNGGFLGNKTYTVRKLKVYPNSKIPKYFDRIVDDPYIVSSLGLATREGYSLMGWYLEENATYIPDENGMYIKLSVEEDNGIYNLNNEGEYVLDYVAHEYGRYIFIPVEDIPDDTDPDLVEYIYYEGSNGFGFYIYDPDKTDHVEIYEQMGGEGYAPGKLSAYGSSYLIYDDLTEDEKELFDDIPRVNREFRPYTDEDSELDRYSLETGYAEIGAIMETNTNGSYVLIDDQYVLYDEENNDHQDLQRYSIIERYKFTPTDLIPTPSVLPKYDATIIYWDFEKDRVNEDITLKAHWVKKLTVEYREPSGQITYVTTKRNDTGTDDILLARGETIGKLEKIPIYSGHTFVGWSKSETEYDPWDFKNDVFPDDTDTLALYAYMVSGTYTRITSPSGLAAVASNPNQNYLLCNDIDLKGAVFRNKSPLGFSITATGDAINLDGLIFTGEFLSMGCTISNFILEVSNVQKPIFENSGIEYILGLFPYVQNASIEGLKVENCQVKINTKARINDVILDSGASGLIGTALEGTTNVVNCSVEITFEVTQPTTFDKNIYIGAIVAKGYDNCIIDDITKQNVNIDYSAIVDNVNFVPPGSLIVEPLD